METNFFNTLMYKRQVLLIALCIIVVKMPRAQNQFGMIGGNYAGLQALKINPANICYQPVSLDINVASLYANINNNHYYSTPTFLPSYDSLKPVIANSKFDEASIIPANFIVRNDIQSTGYVFGSVNAMGPSMLMALSTKRSFAITTSFRSHVSGTNISGSSALALFEGPTYNQLQNTQLQMQNTKVAFASWYELGGSYAQVLKENMQYVHRVGASLKLLLGTTGGYIYDRGFNGYNETGRDLQMNNSSFSYAYAGPENTSKMTNSQLMSVRGMGSSFDLGYSVQRKEKNRNRRNICPNLFGYTDVSCEYKWKFGVSLLDIGAIKYYNNSFATDINGGNSDWKNWDAVLKYNPRQIDSVFRTKITGDIKASESFWLLMPGALSAQFDYKFAEGFYLNTIVVQRITPSFTPSLARMNSIAIIPRFEKENIEVGMPFILNEYKSPNIGLSLRFKYVMIGSDRFGETFGLKTMYGADFYAALRYSISERCKKVRKVF